MPRTDLDAAIRELYGAPREDFIARRKELARVTRAAGEADAAARIEKLAKPTTAAWVANQLARTDQDQVAELAGLGDALRRAHQELNGAELKSLGQRRTDLIGALVRRAEQRNEPGLSESVLRELEDILARAVADEEAGGALVSGCLTSAKGFAPMSGWPSLPVGGDPRAERAGGKAAGKSAGRKEKAPGGERRSADETRLARAREALDEARAAVKEAEAARAEDERSLADAEAAEAEAAAEVKRLGEELDAAETKEKRARGLVGLARRAVKEAERQAGQAWRQVQLAEQRLADLDRT